MNKWGYRILGISIVLLVIYFPLFLHLGSLPIAIWDESLFALRALHFFQEGSYLYNFNFYHDLPNHQNTKLPFTTFFQVMGYHLLGVNELAVRLPLIALFLAIQGYLIYYFHKYFNTLWPGVIMLLILVASPGFVQPHMLRTGDQDVAFAMYLTLGVLFFYSYVQFGKTGFLWAFVIAFLAALLTKNLLAGIIGPGLLLFLLMEGKARELLKKRDLYIALAVIIGVYGGTLWYFETQQTGFIQRMWDYELMGRYSTTIEGHSGGPMYYFNQLMEGIPVFFFPAIFSLLILWEDRAPKPLKSLILLLWCVSLSYGFIISLSETKTMWYSAPLYPFTALLSGLSFWYIYKYYLIDRTKSWKWVGGCLMLVLYAVVYYNTVDANYKPEPYQKGEKYGLFLKKLDRAHSDFTDFVIIDNNFGTSAYFYKEMYNRKDPKYNIQYQRTFEVEIGTRVMSCLNNVLRPLDQQYEFRILEEYYDCKLIEITGLKE